MEDSITLRFVRDDVVQSSPDRNTRMGVDDRFFDWVFGKDRKQVEEEEDLILSP